MKCNVGGADRTLRFALGAALIGVGLFVEMSEGLRIATSQRRPSRSSPRRFATVLRTRSSASTAAARLREPTTRRGPAEPSPARQATHDRGGCCHSGRGCFPVHR